MFAARNAFLAGGIIPTGPVVFKSGATSSTSTSITIPSHAAGDMILIAAGNVVGSTSPSLPSASGTVPSFSTLSSYSSATPGFRIGYAVATSNNHTSGDWTNASRMLCCVLSGQAASPLGGTSSVGTMTDATTVAFNAVTLTKTDGTNQLLQIFFANGAVYNVGSSYPDPTGYTIRSPKDGTTRGWGLLTKNSPSTDGALNLTTDFGTQRSCTTIQIEIV